MESGPLEPVPLQASRMTQEPPEAEIRPRTRHGVWYLLGLIVAGWQRGWPTRLGLLAAVLILGWVVVVPAMLVVVAHVGAVVALLAGVYAGGWLAGKLVGPVSATLALQELAMFAFVVWLVSVAAASRITYRLTRRRAASGTSCPTS